MYLLRRVPYDATHQDTNNLGEPPHVAVLHLRQVTVVIGAQMQSRWWGPFARWPHLWRYYVAPDVGVPPETVPGWIAYSFTQSKWLDPSEKLIDGDTILLSEIQ